MELRNLGLRVNWDDEKEVYMVWSGDRVPLQEMPLSGIEANELADSCFDFFIVDAATDEQEKLLEDGNFRSRISDALQSDKTDAMVELEDELMNVFNN